MTPPIDFAALFEQSPNPYVLLDRDFVIVSANTAYLTSTDRKREDIIGRAMFDAFPADPDSASYKQLRTSLERVVENNRIDHLPLIRYDIEREGRIDQVYWSATHTPLAGPDGKCAYILQHTTDVTELHRLRTMAETMTTGVNRQALESEIIKRAEAMQEINDELGQQVRQLQLLFEQAPGFMAVLWGPEHIFTMANAAYEQVVGGRDVTGQTVAQALPEVVGQGFVQLLDKVYSQGEAYIGRRMPIRIAQSQDGPLEDRFLDFIYQPILGPDNEVSGIFVQGHDVTEEVVAAEKLRELNESLEARVSEAIAERQEIEQALQQAQKMESLGKLTGGVAHDFNNLLQVISGNIQLLQKDVKASPKAMSRIENALSGVERGAKLAGQLLAFGRRQPLEPRAINVGRLVNGMGDMLRRVLGEEVQVETMVAGGLWNTLVDPNQIENALLNLAINARDAMNGAGKLTIEVGNAFLDASYSERHDEVQAGQYVVVAVTDTGVGIPRGMLNKVFEPFYTTKPEGHGSGLGLSMVYGFIKQSGGHVKIYSEEGEGTTVRLYLPRTHDAEDIVETVDRGPIAGGSETILVVEDDDAVRATVVDMLDELGYKVLKAADTQSALAIIESGATIDLLFTDVVMPGTLKSPELARRAKQAIPNLAVLFTSGYTENSIVHGGRLDPGVELLSKPYARSALASRIRQVLASRKQANADPVEDASASSTKPVALVVEDDPLIRMTTAEMVEQLGYQVLESATAEEAIKVLGEHSVRVLVTDIGLPGMSGVELANQASRAYPGISVVVATGHTVAPSDLSPGAVILSKPFDEGRVRDALKKATGMGSDTPN